MHRNVGELREELRLGRAFVEEVRIACSDCAEAQAEADARYIKALAEYNVAFDEAITAHNESLAEYNEAHAVWRKAWEEFLGFRV